MDKNEKNRCIYFNKFNISNSLFISLHHIFKNEFENILGMGLPFALRPPQIEIYELKQLAFICGNNKISEASCNILRIISTLIVMVAIYFQRIIILMTQMQIFDKGKCVRKIINEVQKDWVVATVSKYNSGLFNDSSYYRTRTAGMKIFHCKMAVMIKRYLNLFAFIFFLVSSKAQIRSLHGKEISRAGMDQFLKQQMDSLGIPGMSIAIINNGRIAYHRALGTVSVVSRQPVNDNSIFEAASLSKPLFAYFLMKMVDKGLLRLDTPLYKYMPYTDIEHDGRYKLITARLVLSHQTGFPNWRYFNKADSSLHVKDGDLYIKFTPGSQFSYSGEGYLYLAKVIAFLEHRTLQTLEPLFQQEVDRPLGMEQAWYTGNRFISKHKVSGHENGKVFGHPEGGLWGHDESSNGYAWPTVFPGWDSSWFNPAASLHTEAVSYAHFLISLMHGKGLSKKSLQDMLTPQVMLPKDNILYKLYQDPAWGLGIGIIGTPWGMRYDHAGSNGNFESHAVFYKDRKYGYVFFVNCNKGDDFYKRLNELLGTTTTEK